MLQSKRVCSLITWFFFHSRAGESIFFETRVDSFIIVRIYIDIETTARLSGGDVSCLSAAIKMFFFKYPLRLFLRASYTEKREQDARSPRIHVHVPDASCTRTSLNRYSLSSQPPSRTERFFQCGTKIPNERSFHIYVLKIQSHFAHTRVRLC